MAACKTTEQKPKVRYETRAEAKAALKRYAKLYELQDNYKVYRCPHCEYFHLGHYPATEEARAGLRAQHREEPS